MAGYTTRQTEQLDDIVARMGRTRAAMADGDAPPADVERDLRAALEQLGELVEQIRRA